MKFLRILFVIFISSLQLFAFAKNSNECINPNLGVNLAGPEFAPSMLPGISRVNYKFPTEDQILKYKGIGFNSIRLPILWERVQPVLFGPLDDAYLLEIKLLLYTAQKYNLNVLLDLHNYGKYRGHVVGISETVGSDALVDVWVKIAKTLAYSRALSAYGLMNEPNHRNRVWHSIAQGVVDGIRSVDRVRTIYVAGDGWSSAEKWAEANPRPFVIDPTNNLVYEAHLYLDDDSSGRYATPLLDRELARSRVKSRLEPFFKWLRQYHVKGAIGEFGIPSDEPEWFDTLDEFYSLMRENCMPSYYWAGGAFSPGYKLSLEPKFGRERMIISVLRSALSIRKD